MALLIVNFGGPRSLSEIGSFLEELLTDPDVIRTKFPSLIQNWLFRKIARKRAGKMAPDYERIGGRSPIYFDTEEIGNRLRERFGGSVLCFHRYLPATHSETIKQIESLSDEIISVLPLFPQFSYATTGSIARFFQKHLTQNTIKKLRWISSYCDYPAYIACWQRKIDLFLKQHNLKNPVLLFSAHGLPVSFIKKGDPYQTQCEKTFQKVMEAFPDCLGKLCYQSKFGPGEWLRPYTDEACEQILSWNGKKQPVVFIPVSFTSDHIETLYEIEELYLPLIREKNLAAYRCPAFNLEEDWLEVLADLVVSAGVIENYRLVRRRIFNNHVVSSLL